MLAESHLYDSLGRNTFSTTGEAMCIYEDPAYPLRIHLQAPFRNRLLEEEEEETLLIYTAQGSPFRRKKAVCYQWEP